jgi:hypothetical protein
MVLMKKLRVFYFFAQGREGVTNYIKEIKALPVYLKQDGRTIGEIIFDMNDFLSDKVTKREFYKLFSGSLEDIPILSWGLQFSFGLVASKVTDVSRIHLQEHMGIYLPDKFYYTFEPLPQEWLNIIEKNQEFDMIPAPVRPETSNPRKITLPFVNESKEFKNYRGLWNIIRQAKEKQKKGKTQDYFNPKDRFFSAFGLRKHELRKRIQPVKRGLFKQVQCQRQALLFW